jgi:TonB family protein
MRSDGVGRFRRSGAWWATAVVVLMASALTWAAEPPWTPPKFLDGNLPALPTAAVGGGQVLLDVHINEAGSVDGVDVLRRTPPFTDGAVAAVQGWRFDPARAIGQPVAGDPPPTKPEPVPSRVLVALVYRPPVLVGPTLGQAPDDVGTPSPEIVFPTNIVTPPFPPMAREGGVVLVEVKVGERGQVTSASVRQSGAGFDDVALQAARAWTFRPARIKGTPEQTVAYLVFVFRQPITAQAR